MRYFAMNKMNNVKNKYNVKECFICSKKLNPNIFYFHNHMNNVYFCSECGNKFNNEEYSQIKLYLNGEII